MLDDKELSEYLKNSAAFSMKLKKYIRELHKFLEYHPDSSIPIEIRRDEMTELNYWKLDWKNSVVIHYMYWKSFKETFKAVFHSSDSINNIEKFTYFKTYLDKSELQAIEGFPLANKNYKAAWQLLDERCGNEQLIISCH